MGLTARVTAYALAMHRPLGLQLRRFALACDVSQGSHFSFFAHTRKPQLYIGRHERQCNGNWAPCHASKSAKMLIVNAVLRPTKMQQRTRLECCLPWLPHRKQSVKPSPARCLLMPPSPFDVTQCRHCSELDSVTQLLDTSCCQLPGSICVCSSGHRGGTFQQLLCA